MRAHFNPVSLWMRGLLQEECGVSVRSLKIRTKQQEQVPGWQPPDWMEIERLPKGQKVEGGACGRIFVRSRKNIICAPRSFRFVTSWLSRIRFWNAFGGWREVSSQPSLKPRRWGSNM